MFTVTLRNVFASNFFVRIFSQFNVIILFYLLFYWCLSQEDTSFGNLSWNYKKVTKYVKNTKTTITYIYHKYIPQNPKSLNNFLKLLKMHSRLDLRHFLAPKSPLKIMKNAFYFTLKALSILRISKFLSSFFSHTQKNCLVRKKR